MADNGDDPQTGGIAAGRQPSIPRPPGGAAPAAAPRFVPLSRPDGGPLAGNTLPRTAGPSIGSDPVRLSVRSPRSQGSPGGREETREREAEGGVSLGSRAPQGGPGGCVLAVARARSRTPTAPTALGEPERNPRPHEGETGGTQAERTRKSSCGAVSPGPCPWPTGRRPSLSSDPPGTRQRNASLRCQRAGSPVPGRSDRGGPETPIPE